MHRTTIGDFELTIFSDGKYLLDGGAFFGVVPKVMWAKKVNVDDKNRVLTGLNSLLVRTGDRNILIETGIGNKLSERMQKLVNDPKSDLHKPFPWGDGQNLLREALLLADHNAYHLGEFVVLRRLLGAWKK